MATNQEPVFLGEGAYRYRVDTEWAKLPDGWALGDVGGVAVGPNDDVYVFNRGKHPMIVFDRDGNFLRSWGEGVFKNPHGVHIGHDNHIYCTDDGDHTVRKCTLDGEVVLTLGLPGRPAPFHSGQPFCRCTHTALSPEGHIYVADGYGNARVHKYSCDGELIGSWGEAGTDPGCFNVVHNICCDGDGLVYVADRENHRIQIFDGEGGLQGHWNSLHRPCALSLASSSGGLFYVGELGSVMAINRDTPNIGPRITILDKNGDRVGRLGDLGYGHRPNQFIAPHGIAADSRGDIYIGEVSNATWPMAFPNETPEHPLRVFRKLVLAPSV